MSQSVSLFSPSAPSHFLHLVRRFGLQATGFACPAAQEALATLAGELEEVVVGVAQFRLGAGNRRIGVDQIVRSVGRATRLAVVAVLILGSALRAFALDETVGQEHLLDRVVVLLDGAFLDQPGVLQARVDGVRAFLRFRRMRAVEVVEGDVEAGEIARVFAMHALDQRFRRDAILLGAQHDRRAVRIVGAHVPALGNLVLGLHFLEAYPDIGLDVFDQVAKVNGTVGVGQGGSDEDFAGHELRSLILLGFSETRKNRHSSKVQVDHVFS